MQDSIKAQEGPNPQASSKNLFREQFELNGGVANSFAIKEKLYAKQSEYQKIEVFDTVSFGKMLVHDGVVMVSQYDNYAYHEMIAHVPMLAHPNPERVLIVGGGDGGTLQEVLKHPCVKEAVLCEIDGDVIEVSKKYFPELSSGFTDSRAVIEVQDAAEYIKNKKNYFDVICVDSSDPIGPAEILFKRKFYEDVCAALTQDGIAVTQSESPYYYRDLIVHLYRQNLEIFSFASYYYALVPTYPSGTIGFSFCSKKYNALECYDATRVKQLGNLRYYSEEMQRAAFVLPAFLKDRLQQK